MTDATQVIVATDEMDLASRVSQSLADLLASSGVHHVVLTGGGIGTTVLASLAERSTVIDWSRVHLWWGDERFLPEGDGDRNETGARRALIDHMPIPPSNVHPMPSDRGQGADAAARAYADELAAYSSDGFVPDFDIVMLGMGPEGHVASLFPGMAALHSASSTVAITDSPKPPPVRVSLTLRAIRAARQVWVVASGPGKADAVCLALAPGTPAEVCPAAAARGREATIVWLDPGAAGRV